MYSSDANQFTQSAEQISDEYHELFVDALDELQGMSHEMSQRHFEHLQQYVDRMQFLSETWDILTEQLKEMANASRNQSLSQWGLRQLHVALP